jgi:hypothetical protein
VPWHGANACGNHANYSSSCVICTRCVLWNELPSDLPKRECVHVHVCVYQWVSMRERERERKQCAISLL